MPRRLTSPQSRISARTYAEAIDDGDTCSIPDPERLPTSSDQNRSDTSRILSDQPVERLLISPDIASYPSSPNTRIQQAVAAFEFTTLHAEALSFNYMKTPFSSPPPELELVSTGQAYSDVQASTPSTILVRDEDILTLGPVFDPLWDPVVTKTAAINGYVADLHREIMINAGLWGRERPFHS